MAELTLTDAGIWIEGRSYSGVSNQVTLELSADAPTKTTFGDGGNMTRAAGGLKTSAFSLEGYYDTVGPDADQFASMGAARSVMVVPDDMTAGAVAYVVPVTVGAYTPLAGTVGELAGMTYASEGNGAAVRAQVMDVREGMDADATTTRVQLGTVAAGETLQVWLHVTENAATGTLTVTLRSSASQIGGVTNRGTVTPTDTGLHRISFTGTIPANHRWWELAYDVGGVTPDYDIAAAARIA